MESAGVVAAPRQRRSLRNDEAILDAAVWLAAEQGWAALTPGRLAEVTGLSRPTVLHRHPDRVAVGVGLWRQRLAVPLREACEALVALAGCPTASTDLFRGRLAPFLRPQALMRAAVELLQVSTYTPRLAQAVEETMGDWLSAWTAPRRAGQVDTAQRVFLVAVGLGYVLEDGRQGRLDVDLNEEVALFASALRHPAPPVRLPGASADHLDEPVAFATGESSWDAVLAATLDCVGDLGYEAATIETIAAAAGYTRTVIFGRYPTKRALFLDACHRMFGPAVALNDAFQRSLQASRSTAVAEACFVRELMRPQRRRMRTITLEQLRLATHDPALQSAMREALMCPEREMVAGQGLATVDARRARITTEMAMTNGLEMIAQLRPDAWRLPFDVVLVPWRARCGL